MRKLFGRLISVKGSFSEFLARQAKAKAERAKARTVVKRSFLDRVGRFCSGLFQDIGQLRKKFSELRIERAKAQAEARSAKLTALAEYKKTKAALRLELLDRLGQKCSGMFRKLAALRGEFTEYNIDRSNAKIQRRLAKANAKKFEAEARAAKWEKIFQALGKQFRFTFKRWADYRKQRLARKIVHQRAKTEKWRAIDNAVTKFFTALRKELGELFDWMGKVLKPRSKKSGPNMVNNSVSKVSRTVSVLLALGFLTLTVLGIMFDNYWIWTLAPLGMVWAFGYRLLFPKDKFLLRLGRVGLLCLTLFWAGSWLIFRMPTPQSSVNKQEQKVKSEPKEKKPQMPRLTEKPSEII